MHLQKLGFGLGQDVTIIGVLNLNMMLKIEFSQINVAYGLTKDIKGYHIHIWSSSNSFIDKSNDGYTVSLIVYWLHNLVILKIEKKHEKKT